VRGKFVSRAFFTPRGAWVVVEHFVVGISKMWDGLWYRGGNRARIGFFFREKEWERWALSRGLRN